MEWWIWTLIVIYIIGWLVSFVKLFNFAEKPTESFGRATLLILIFSCLSSFWPLHVVTWPIIRRVEESKNEKLKKVGRTALTVLFCSAGYLMTILVWPARNNFSWSALIAFISFYLVFKFLFRLAGGWRIKKRMGN